MSAYLLSASAQKTAASHRTAWAAQFPGRHGKRVALATVLLMMLVVADRAAAQSGAFIFVTSLQDKISSTGGCSLQEAIYSANFDNNVAIDYVNPDGSDHFIITQCVPGNGDDTIVLPSGGVFQLSRIFDDAHNTLGLTATPIITSNIVIEASGALLEWIGSKKARAFAVDSTGNLTIRNAYLKGFQAKGGDGSDGGGGGMGAGGAIYVHGGGLVIENCTFAGNGATGGNGGTGTPNGGGGGGGLGGNGGRANGQLAGAGGGGSRGNGGNPEVTTNSFSNGGGGGGTVTAGGNGGGNPGPGGFACGGTAGDIFGGDGQSAVCAGGGGGGGGYANQLFTGDGNGGNGNYGGGGGGGGLNGNAGSGGFGGGGGSTQENNGGNGGFGGGGGGTLGGTTGKGGLFGGHGSTFSDGGAISGGGGAALGGAIFNDSGSVVVRNSTFNNNFVVRGVAGSAPADNGADQGGAVFSLNGHLTVNDVTIAGNQSTGSGGGIVVYQTSGDPLPPTSFFLYNTIIFNNGAMDANGNLTSALNECSISGVSLAGGGAGNLIQNNDDCPGVVSSADPQLGPLQHNGGTPTMAISKYSPAFNAADPATSLLTAQNLVVRPSFGGFDIGAFEVCTLSRFVACSGGLAPPPNTESLTTLASPVAGGTVNPPSGSFPLDSVVVLTATPNAGYSFINWTGAVADLNNPTTTVIMDQSQTVTANFIAQPTTMTGNIIAKTGPQNARTWKLSLLDNGPGGAYETSIPSFTLVQTYGAACTPVIGTAFPLAVGNISATQTGTANVALDFTGCASSARFTAKFTYSANSGTVSGFVVRYNQYQ